MIDLCFYFYLFITNYISAYFYYIDFLYFYIDTLLISNYFYIFIIFYLYDDMTLFLFFIAYTCIDDMFISGNINNFISFDDSSRDI
jgi:hypothetical protein